jgi:hypothetical protein
MNERIYDIQAREAVKVAIRRPQFTHSQDVGVDGDHPPRPSYARSRILSQLEPRNSGTNPRPLNVTLRSRNGRALFRSAMILRRPRSTNARRVVRSRLAIFRASRKSASDMSRVVFTFHTPDLVDMGRRWTPIFSATATSPRAASTTGSTPHCRRSSVRTPCRGRRAG